MPAPGARLSGFSHCFAFSGTGERSESLPLGVPASTQATRVATSRSLSRASLRNFKLRVGSAGHGGIDRARTCCLMAWAADWAASYDSRESWQLAQCSIRIGATSLENVGAAPAPAEDNASPH